MECFLDYSLYVDKVVECGCMTCITPTITVSGV